MRKHKYEEQLRSQVRQWQARIDRLKDRIDQGSNETRRVIEHQIQDLQAKQQAARRKLEQLHRAAQTEPSVRPVVAPARAVLRGVRRAIGKLVPGGK